jgi:hypothetical protein
MNSEVATDSIPKTYGKLPTGQPNRIIVLH